MDPSLTSGTHARELIARQLGRLRTLQPDVLADRDPEPLHQFRVSLRRLRALLNQFGPALVLPAGVSRQRIAAVARVTGRCRDADVLKLQLREQLLPRLERQAQLDCAPLLRHLRRRRRRAFEELEDALRAQRTAKLLRRLERWSERPRFTTLGELSLQDWLQEWLLACTGSCFLHDGWFARDPAAVELHALRKTIKEVRYGMEALGPWLGEAGERWLQRWRQVQSCLGDLHDQQVLLALLQELPSPGGDGITPLLRALGEQHQQRWGEWQQLSGDLLQPWCRQELAALGATARATPS